MSSPYTYSHKPDVYDGQIGVNPPIRVFWQAAGIAKLVQDAGLLGVPVDTLKRLSEHFSYLCAHRLGSAEVMIRSGPHQFTVDTKNNRRSADDDHVSVELRGGTHGKRKCHIYIKGHGSGAGAYDNIEMRGEGVMEKRGKVPKRDAMLCEGEVDGVLYGAAAGTRGSSSSNQGATYSSWGAGYQAGGYQAGGGGTGYGSATSGGGASGAGPSSSGEGGTYTEWQLASDGQTWIRYNHGTGGWEDQYGRALG